MARLRRTSQVLKAAQQRLAGLKSINSAPDFGTVLFAYETTFTSLIGQLENYDQQVAALDDLQNAEPTPVRDDQRGISIAASYV